MSATRDSASDTSRQRTDLENYELEDRPPFVLTLPEVKLLGIAGVRIHSLLVTRPELTPSPQRLGSSLTVGVFGTHGNRTLNTFPSAYDLFIINVRFFHHQKI